MNSFAHYVVLPMHVHTTMSDSVSLSPLPTRSNQSVATAALLPRFPPFLFESLDTSFGLSGVTPTEATTPKSNSFRMTTELTASIFYSSQGHSLEGVEKTLNEESQGGSSGQTTGVLCTEDIGLLVPQQKSRTDTGTLTALQEMNKEHYHVCLCV